MININGTQRELTESERKIFFTALTAEELKKSYDELTVFLIREKYTENEEAKVIREYLATGNKADFDEYHAYVENCKATARAIVYRGTDTNDNRRIGIDRS